MTDAVPKFRRAPAELRRQTLIDATLALIADQGARAATVRAIAERADVTPGLIRHYFSSKEDLVMAAYAYHMRQMTDLTAYNAGKTQDSPRTRLAAFVVAGLEPPVMDSGSVSLWAGFLNMVKQDARIRDIHEQTYRDFRDRLEALIADTLSEAKMPVCSGELRRLAIACNAVIDGLWMEGGALPDAFVSGELRAIGLRSVGALIGVDLTEKESAA